MAKEYVAVIGSGTVPNIGPFTPSMSGAFPDGRYPQTAHYGKLYGRMGTGSVILNPEDFSVFLGVRAQAISVGGSVVPLPTSPLENRRALAIHNNGPGILYIGDINVTTLTGYPLAVNEKIGLDITGNDNVIIYGVSDSISDARIFELA
jgi:hypothetical protein